MKNFDYKLNYKNLNFRDTPHLYRIGRGEQGVLLIEPYKSEILPHWRFKDPVVSLISANSIWSMFKSYLSQNDFIGADMSRKFLQMGWTRARRYANHPSGIKYSNIGAIHPQAIDALISKKAKSAAIFKKFYDTAKSDPLYMEMYNKWRTWEFSCTDPSADNIPVKPLWLNFII
jgi:hypothetical protein